jgi:hypothetical protein
MSDPMQSGAGEQRSGRDFSMFSDYNARRIYDNLAGASYGALSNVVQLLPATMAPNDGKTYKLFDSSGRAFWQEDITPAADGSKFARWDNTANTNMALPYALEFPQQQNVPGNCQRTSLQ